MSNTVIAPGSPDIDALRSAYADFRAQNPRAYMRDAAGALGVSEAELFVADSGAELVELRPPTWEELVGELPGLGTLKTMTRNDVAVIEKEGAYEEVKFFGHAGQVVGSDIELRIFPKAWSTGYAFTDNRGASPRRSLQFFDPQGISIHKLYLGENSSVSAFEEIVARWGTRPAKMPRIVPGNRPAERPDSEIDIAEFRAAWDGLHHTHDFFDMLRRFRVTRTQAFRLAGEERAHRVEVASVERLLTAASGTSLPIMIFAGNRGMIQIYIGTVKRIVRMNGWLNVLDPGFNLHLRDELVDSAWVVRKASDHGTVTSLELFDRRGDVVTQFFSKRADGAPESEIWREMVRQSL